MHLTGYVMQDDALYPLLTVRETFQYAAQLRIANISAAQQQQIVEETLVALKLTACADTVIGDYRTRGCVRDGVASTMYVCNTCCCQPGTPPYAIRNLP